MSKFLLVAITFGLLSSPGLAQEKSPQELREESSRIWSIEGLKQERYTRVVVSGKNSRVGFFTSLNPDCSSSADVNIRFNKQPEHGTVETSTTTHFPGYPKESVRFKCNQHRVKGTEIRYKSAEKYVGDDAFDMLVIFGDGIAWEGHFDISVR
jgi:hypothetical protein